MAARPPSSAPFRTRTCSKDGGLWASGRSLCLIDGGDFPFASWSTGVAEVIGLERANGRDRHPASPARRQQHLVMGRRRRRRAFPLGRIKANKWHRNCPDLGDRGAGIGGRHGDGRLGGEGEIPFDRLVNAMQQRPREQLGGAASDRRCKSAGCWLGALATTYRDAGFFRICLSPEVVQVPGWSAVSIRCYGPPRTSASARRCVAALSRGRCCRLGGDDRA
jgi:hypothetical protein